MARRASSKSSPHKASPHKTSSYKTGEPAAPEAERYDFSKQVGYLLRRAYQRHTAIFQKTCIDPQLTSVQFAVLCAIRDNSPCFLTTICRAAAIDPATTRGVIERLKERDLISVAPDSVDRRRVFVQLKTAGRRLVEEMVPYSLKITELTVSGLNPAERFALTYLLAKIGDMDVASDDIEALEAQHSDAEAV